MLLAFALAAAAARAAEPPASRPAQSGEGDVLNFSLLDYRGRHYELRRADAQLDLMFALGRVAPRDRMGDRYVVQGMRRSPPETGWVA